jgi:hypothetical protein
MRSFIMDGCRTSLTHRSRRVARSNRQSSAIPHGAPVVHLAALTFAMGTPPRSGSGRRERLHSTRTVRAYNARWQLLAATRNQKGIAAFLGEADSMPAIDLVSIPFFALTDSTTIAHQDELFQAAHRLAATRDERWQVIFGRVIALWNRGRPAEASLWLDTLFTINSGIRLSCP